MTNFHHHKFPTSIEKEISKLKSKKASYWEQNGKRKAVELFNYTAGKTSGYQRFLKRNSFKTRKIISFKKFKDIPPVSKKNYLVKTRYMDLFPGKDNGEISTISSTSGSTGEPFYFPRGEGHDRQYEYVAEIFLKNQFEVDKYKTLAINGFGMGIWIGGIFTYKVFNKISSKGYKLSVAPTGRNKEIFLKVFKKMAPYYDQIILMGYPPFIKDVVDESESYDINWKKHKLRILTATEAFTEDFRDYLVGKTGIKNPLTDTLNIYGSVEFGTMSHETPLSILIRKLACSDKKLFKEIFPGARTIPTLVQYYPHIVYFEEVRGELFATGYGSSIPLIRYRFFDKGGVYGFDEMVRKLKGLGIDILKIAKDRGIRKTVFKLPFVYVHERSDFVVNLRGANIYPGHVRSALHRKEVRTSVTGKFTMVVKEDRNLNEYLEINVEMKKGVQKGKALSKRVQGIIVNGLLRNNSEFGNMYSSETEKATPKVILHKNSDPKYFSDSAIKQKWVIK